MIEIIAILIDSPLTRTRAKFLTTNRLPSNMIRNNETILRNPKKKREKKTKENRRFVHFFTAQISLFHSARGLRGEKKKNETRAKLDNRGTQHGGDSPQRRAGTVLDDAGTDGCVASLTRGRAIVCGLVLPIRQRLSTPKPLSFSLYLSILPHHVDVI